MSPDTLLKFALAVFGTILLLVYPLAVVWPSGWAWHAGAPHDSQYFMMIVGVYATLGVFLLAVMVIALGAVCLVITEKLKP